MENMISYLYLNVYYHPKYGYFLYVGSCSRKDNVSGRLNSKYHDSSSLIKQFHWQKFLVKEIFIKNTTNPLKAESELIDWVLFTYGVHPLIRDRNPWLLKYPVGICINGHNNTLSHALEKLKQEGPSELQINQRRLARLKALESVTKEQRLSSIKKANASVSTSQRIENLSHSDRAKAIASRLKLGYKQSIIKSIQTRYFNDVKPIHRVTECNGIVGSVQYVCTVLGHKNWNVAVSRKFSSGLTTVFHHGFQFKLLF